MSLSANTLFHFTQSFDTQIGILQTKFYPRACLESQVLSDIFPFRFAPPMVCFCDIPLSQISDHVEKYGNYAIGIKKDWAMQQGVSPVLYVHEKSPVLQAIVKEIKDLKITKTADGNLPDESMSKLMSYIQTAMMMKQYEGFDERHNKIVRYYDEREWRYIPPNTYPDEPSFLLDRLYDDEKLRASFNQSKTRYGVEFHPDVINYLIVAKESEILPLKRKLVTIKGGFSHDAVELLTTRIISMERIQQDL